MTALTLDDIRAAAERSVETALDRDMRIAPCRRRRTPKASGLRLWRRSFASSATSRRSTTSRMCTPGVATRTARSSWCWRTSTPSSRPGTPIEVRRDDEFLYGPGIGDNASNVSGMLTALQILDEFKVETDVDIIAVATVGEEGLGNLRGARRAVERYRDQVGAVIVLDGRVGRITNTAVGSIRWKVTVSGAGGPSFGAFGIPSAIHGLGRIIAAIADIEVPADPKTTFNVGVIEGGTSVNTIAPSASMIVDMRSVDAGELNELAAQVRQFIEEKPATA